MERLRLEKVSKVFGQNQVLHDMSLSVSAGEIVALLGDNGAGKSTLIKIISGFHAPSSGALIWEKTPIETSQFSPQKARNLGIQTVYQHLGLVDQLSIARNFFLGQEPKVGPFLRHDFMRQVVREQMQDMGIARKLNPDSPVALLSGGERQVVAIARARYFGAKLLILDEPTSALSLNQTQKVLDYICEAGRLGISVIFITHSLHHIKNIVDTVFVIHKGRVVGELRDDGIDEQTTARLIIHGHGGGLDIGAG